MTSAALDWLRRFCIWAHFFTASTDIREARASACAKSLSPLAALAADVEVPGQALCGLAAGHLMQWIVLVLRDGDANLNRPVTIGNVRSDLRFRIPAEPLAFRRGSIKVNDCAGRADGDLIIGVR